MKKKDHRHKVSTVEPGSIAEELGIFCWPSTIRRSRISSIIIT